MNLDKLLYPAYIYRNSWKIGSWQQWWIVSNIVRDILVLPQISENRWHSADILVCCVVQFEARRRTSSLDLKDSTAVISFNNPSYTFCLSCP
jgi:hypothetical protein